MFIKASGASLDALRESIAANSQKFLNTLDQMYGNLTTLQDGWQSDLSASAHTAVDTKLIQAGQDLRAVLDLMGINVEDYGTQMASNERAAANAWSA
jgi:uncharacterized protein YukE